MVGRVSVVGGNGKLDELFYEEYYWKQVGAGGRCVDAGGNSGC